MSDGTQLRPIMFVGTGSDVGKSVINAAFCRIFQQDGYSPAPFKAQNMSLNSYVTEDGLEMGRAQVVQAEACGIPCQIEMNPVLLKPSSDQKAQVIVNGKPIGTQSAMEYFRSTDRDELFAEVISSYHRLAEKYSPIVIEGAGSISELNLRDRDITNMRVALAAKADTYLIADIDKGGIFGSIYGTLELLPTEERALIKGIIVNKFRGDRRLFDDGVELLERITGVPVVAVIPFFRDIQIDEEDSVSIQKKARSLAVEKINIAVVLLPHMSNFTDFNALELVPEVCLFYTHHHEDILNADIVILPGSKNTMEDLAYLRKSGLAQTILQTQKRGNALYGVCGGYQMMGESIHDPHGVEGEIKSMPGLGILPVTTTLAEEKVTQQRAFHFLNEVEIGKGYEIHMGHSEFTSQAQHLCEFTDGTPEGCYRDEQAWGTYIHGIFDNAFVISHILSKASAKQIQPFDFQAHKEEQYDALAAVVREHTDIEKIYASLKR